MEADFWCIAEHWLQFASGVLAGCAAITWFMASRIKPSAALTRLAEGIAHVTEREFLHEQSAIAQITIRQSRTNAIAALFAAGAAIIQLPLAFMPTCWSGAPWFSN